MRLVVDGIRSLMPQDAVTALEALPKSAAQSLSKVIASAIANAKQKQKSTRPLFFRKIEVMEGPAMKRWHAVSRGTAHAYKKRMTHVKVILTDEQKEGA